MQFLTQVSANLSVCSENQNFQCRFSDADKLVLAVVILLNRVKCDNQRFQGNLFFPFCCDFAPDVDAAATDEEHEAHRAVAPLEEAGDVGLLGNGIGHLEVLFFLRNELLLLLSMVVPKHLVSYVT